MSSTFTVGRLAAALRAPSGKIIYVLFEETYESNVFPRTPHWSCFYFGDLAGAMERIFGRASAAEGGMLRNRADNLTPESYIAAWLKQLAEPVGYSAHGVVLEVGKSFYSAINDENRDSVRAALESQGRADLIAEAETNGKFAIDVHRDSDLIEVLVKAGVSAWRLISGRGHALSVPEASLGYRPERVRTFDMVVPAFMRVDGDEVLMQREDGSWYGAGWQYRVVADYVEDLWRTEMAEPGTFRKRIEAYRAAVKAAPNVPKGTKVVVDLSVQLEDYQQRSLEETRKSLPAVANKVGFEFVLDPSDKELVWSACRLPKRCTTWVIPKRAAEGISSQHLALDA